MARLVLSTKVAFANLLLWIAICRSLASGHRFAGHDIDINVLFPKVNEPVHSQLAVFSAVDPNGVKLFSTDGQTVKRAKSSLRDDNILFAPRTWAIVKTQDKIVIPAWTIAAMHLRQALDLSDSQSKKFESGWLNLDRRLEAAKNEEERKYIIHMYQERCWARMPPYLKNRLLRATNDDFQKAKELSKDEYRNHRRVRLLESRERYSNKRAGEEAGLVMYRNSFIKIRADETGNIIIEPDRSLLESMKDSKICRVHYHRFYKSWYASAVAAYQEMLKLKARSGSAKQGGLSSSAEDSDDGAKAEKDARSKEHAIARMNSVALRDASVRPAWIPTLPEALRDHNSHLTEDDLKRRERIRQKNVRKRARARARRDAEILERLKKARPDAGPSEEGRSEPEASSEKKRYRDNYRATQPALQVSSLQDGEQRVTHASLSFDQAGSGHSLSHSGNESMRQETGTSLVVAQPSQQVPVSPSRDANEIMAKYLGGWNTQGPSA